MPKRIIMSEEGSKPDKNTVLFLDGTSFDDKSIYRLPVNNFNCKIVADSKFGKCYDCDGARMEINSDLFLFGANDFTLDLWVKLKTSNISQKIACTFISLGEWTILYGFSQQDNKYDLFIGKGANYNWIISAQDMGNPSTNWVHYALVRKNTTFYNFINGAVFSIHQSSDSLFSETKLMINGGWTSDGSLHYPMYIKNVRVSNVARWTSNFTPPTKPY